MEQNRQCRHQDAHIRGASITSAIGGISSERRLDSRYSALIRADSSVVNLQSSSAKRRRRCQRLWASKSVPLSTDTAIGLQVNITQEQLPRKRRFDGFDTTPQTVPVVSLSISTQTDELITERNTSKPHKDDFYDTRFLADLASVFDEISI